MVGIDTVIAAACLGSRAVGRPLKRFFAHALVALSLSLVAAILMVFVIGLMLYGAYLALIAQGLSAGLSLTIVGVIISLLAIIFGMLAKSAFTRTFHFAQGVSMPSLLPFDVGTALESFLSGLLADSPKPSPLAEEIVE